MSNLKAAIEKWRDGLTRTEEYSYDSATAYAEGFTAALELLWPAVEALESIKTVKVMGIETHEAVEADVALNDIRQRVNPNILNALPIHDSPIEAPSVDKPASGEGEKE